MYIFLAHDIHHTYTEYIYFIIAKVVKTNLPIKNMLPICAP